MISQSTSQRFAGTNSRLHYLGFTLAAFSGLLIDDCEV